MKSGRRTRCIPPGTSAITCKIHVGCLQGTTALLEPALDPSLLETLEVQPAVVEIGIGKFSKVKVMVTNKTKGNVFLPKQTVIASLEPIADLEPVPLSEHATVGEVKATRADDDWLSNFQLEHLTPAQKTTVLEMLRGEKDAFSAGDYYYYYRSYIAHNTFGKVSMHFRGKIKTENLNN